MYVMNDDGCRRFWWARHAADVGADWVTFTEEFKAKSRYEPFEHPELPNQLAKVAVAESMLASFVTTYGRLGWRELCRRKIGADGAWCQRRRKEQRRLRVKEDDPGGRRRPSFLAEPIDWIGAHAATVRWCLDSAYALKIEHRRDRNKRCAELMSSRPKPVGVGGGLIGRFDDLEERFGSFSALSNVGFLLTRCLDRNLQGVSWHFWYDGDVYSEVRGDTLLEAIYRQVAEAATGGRYDRYGYRDRNNRYQRWNDRDSGNFTCRIERGRVADLDFSGIRGLR